MNGFLCVFSNTKCLCHAPAGATQRDGTPLKNRSRSSFSFSEPPGKRERVTEVTRADVAQVAKPARSQENAASTGRFGNLRYVAAA
jgi:hypothetical protein